MMLSRCPLSQTASSKHDLKTQTGIDTSSGFKRPTNGRSKRSCLKLAYNPDNIARS